MGLTKSQASLYLALLKCGETDSEKLLEKANLPGQQVFRILSELQEVGLVEKKLVAKAYKVKAIPPEFGLKIVLNQKLKRYQAMQESVIESFQKAHWYFSQFTNPVVFQLTD